jgi:hypothetical protein
MSNVKNSNGAVKAEGIVQKVETKHYLKLIPSTGRSFNLPIGDRNNLPAIDPIYSKYQVFTRVLVHVQYGESVEILKSSPLDVSDVLVNEDAVAQTA